MISDNCQLFTPPPVVLVVVKSFMSNKNPSHPLSLQLSVHVDVEVTRGRIRYRCNLYWPDLRPEGFARNERTIVGLRPSQNSCCLPGGGAHARSHPLRAHAINVCARMIETNLRLIKFNPVLDDSYHPTHTHTSFIP